MIFNKRSDYMLKYEKTKAKLIEFNVAKENYPSFQLDSNDLTYTTLFILSRYCEEIIEHPDSKECADLFEELTKVSQYFDSTVKSRQRENYDNIFLLLGSTAYFLSENFGSARVLIEKINNWSFNGSMATTLYITLYFLLIGEELAVKSNSDISARYLDAVNEHFNSGADCKMVFDAIMGLRDQIYNSSDMFDVTYVDLLYGVTICAIKHSAWVLLPKHSQGTLEEWSGYLSRKESIKLLWPAQKVIVEAGALLGKDLIIPLPTGVGKTKSIELLLRSFFMKSDACVALVIAPLRALCNEIMLDLTATLGELAVVNKFTDTMQEDFSLELLFNTKYVFICTPEKLAYIIRHETDFLSSVKLFIFDEAHLFDDDARGAQYELLVSEIARSRSEFSQMVLFSAVLSNSSQISEWLFKDPDATLNSSLVKSTEKAIGFLSIDNFIHYYEKDQMSEESFFVPGSLDITELTLRPREKKRRFFPEKKAMDFAIYYAIKLCRKDGVAIFVGQARSIPSIMERIADIEKRDYDLSNLTVNADMNQINKLQNLFLLHYGEESKLTVAAGKGAFPHYASLPNGLKMSIEHALRKRQIKFVVCTTTLAEGVNIPIKYLFLTTFNQGQSKIQIRKIQNLIGRTARSGIYTEGSAIVTDTSYYDNRNKWEHGGRYRWLECKKMFDYNNTEACLSTLLRLVSDVPINYRIEDCKAEIISTHLIKHYNSPTCFIELQRKLENECLKNYPELEFDTYKEGIVKKVEQLENIIDSIETYLCYTYNIQNDPAQFIDATEILVSSTFAFYLANEKQKEYLKELFHIVAEKIVEDVNDNNKVYYSKSLYGLKTSNRILEWVDANVMNLTNCQNSQILFALTELFTELFHNQLTVPNDVFLLIMEMWIAGDMYVDIFKKLGNEINLSKIEKICSSTISYDFSFMVGNIIDAIGERYEDARDLLGNLQKQIKYGVPTNFQALICENIFDDRYVANLIENKIENTTDIVTEKQLKHIMTENHRYILELLEDFPEYYIYKFKLYIK